MNILLVYATNSGGTYLTSKIIFQILSKNHTIRVKKAEEVIEDEFKNYDVILIGSPSWDVNGQEGMPHETVLQLIETFSNKKYLNKKFAIFGCGDSSYTHFCGAVDHLEMFVKNLQGTLLTASLRIDGFFFDIDTNTQKIKEWSNDLNSKLGGTNAESDLLIRLQKLADISF